MDTVFGLFVLIVLALFILKFMIDALAGSFFIGPRAREHMWAILAARAVSFVFLAPFRLIRWFVSALVKRP